MPSRLLGHQRQAIVLSVWPELRTFGIGYQIAHGLLVEAVLEDDPKAPVDAATRKRIKDTAKPFLEAK